MVQAAVLLIASGCGDADRADGDLGPAFASGRPAELVGRTFLSEAVADEGTPRHLVEGTRISLEFVDDRQLRASAGCNLLLATYSVRGRRLSIEGRVGGTEMGCGPGLHEQDEWLAGFLEASPTWTLADSRLTLVSEATEIVLLDRQVADPDRPLEGTRWIVDTIIKGDVASSMHAGTEGSAWLRIDGDRFHANTGCRAVQGRVTVSGRRLRFADTFQTDPACSAELEGVDEVMPTVLVGEVEFTIDANRLSLNHPDGVGLGFRADE